MHKSLATMFSLLLYILRLILPVTLTWHMIHMEKLSPRTLYIGLKLQVFVQLVTYLSASIRKIKVL